MLQVYCLIFWALSYQVRVLQRESFQSGESHEPKNA